ncbi:class I SAM-dependent methyltransferase [Alienimonas californiensis]|uniref:Ribosomal protein L11 methyltransferase n=1 Tax=Alienimonas californiensis TaxID=2527989 RepID=A0A517P8D7_9PLAN|nr:50S ribosomal protein L11 methyltransferase [Alienimonas californiensis]QDT15615.1 ribosomal protein L11 methyltransferase [Alienimonas californiensis]
MNDAPPRNADGLPPNADGLPAIAGGWAEQVVGVAHRRGTRTFRLLTPADPDAVLDAVVADQGAEAGGDPYWATLWPVAVTFAGRLLDEPFPAGTRVLELGCGSALAGLAAAAGGAEATATDVDPRAVALAAANAALNGLPLTAAKLDWHAPPALSADQRFDRAIGADLLYQPDLHAALLKTLSATLAADGEALLADPGRGVAAAFLHRASDAGWRVRLEDEAGKELWRPRIAGHQIVRLSR